MGLLDNLRKTLATARSGDVDLSQLTPEQRARYDENMARVEAGRQEGIQAHRDAVAMAEKQVDARALRGPAAELAYGRDVELQDPDAIAALFEQGGHKAILRQQLSLTASQFRDAASDVTSRAPQSVDNPDERMRIEIAERTERDAAAVAFSAESHPGVRVSRIATRGKTQLDQVVDHLVSSGLAAHPDRVYGVYRVPDRISPAMTSTSERGRVVEWDIVHEPTTAPTTAPTGARGAVSIASMSAWDHWVRRSVGESEVIDEELAIALCEVAGVRARDCFGIARSVGIRSLASGDDGSPSFPLARVEGVHVLASRPLDEALDGLTNAAPLDLPHDGWTGVHVAILNWGDIALAVHPQAQRMHVIPSPCHYLPSTPQELLTRYLQIVGVRAAHCFAASVTIDAMRELAGVGSRGFGMSNMGGDEMCADGKVRRRLHGASRVVIVYEDSPDYVAGRDRWQRYQDEVLQATLENGTGARAALAPVDHSDIENPFLRTLVKAASVYDAITMFGEAHAPPPYRYCIPFEPRR